MARKKGFKVIRINSIKKYAARRSKRLRMLHRLIMSGRWLSIWFGCYGDMRIHFRDVARRDWFSCKVEIFRFSFLQKFLCQTHKMQIIVCIHFLVRWLNYFWILIETIVFLISYFLLSVLFDVQNESNRDSI